MLLGLTLRAAKQKSPSPSPVIPHKPHFHNDPNIEDSSSDDQNRTPEPNVQGERRNSQVLNVMPNSNVIQVQPANQECIEMCHI